MAALSNVLRNASSVISSLDGHDYHLTVAEFVAQGNASTGQMLVFLHHYSRNAGSTSVAWETTLRSFESSDTSCHVDS
jgi:hypothetical protein